MRSFRWGTAAAVAAVLGVVGLYLYKAGRHYERKTWVDLATGFGVERVTRRWGVWTHHDEIGPPRSDHIGGVLRQLYADYPPPERPTGHVLVGHRRSGNYAWGAAYHGDRWPTPEGGAILFLRVEVTVLEDEAIKRGTPLPRESVGEFLRRRLDALPRDEPPPPPPN